MNISDSNTARYWVIAWIIAFLGFPPGGALAVALVGPMDTPLQGIIGGAAAGVVIGIAQTLALRTRFSIRWEWAAATALGLGLGVAASVVIFGAGTALDAQLIRAPLTGLVLGLAQWFVLRRHVPRAFWWIIVHVPVYMVAWFVTAQVIRGSLEQGFVVFGASGALLYQVAMGALLWLLARWSAADSGKVG